MDPGWGKSFPTNLGTFWTCQSPNGQLVVWGPVVWIPIGFPDEREKKGILRGTPIQIPNHRAPNQQLTRWWFQIFFIFTPTWGDGSSSSSVDKRNPTYHAAGGHMLSAPRLLLHLAFLGALQECYGNYLQEKILEGSCDLGDCVGGDQNSGNALIQKHAAQAPASNSPKSEQLMKPWDRRQYLVMGTHKSGTHLIRNVMRRTFDALGATSSCAYNSFAIPFTTVGCKQNCTENPSPIRWASWNDPNHIVELRKEGPLRGLMTIRDPMEMVVSAYVYHHRGEEIGPNAAWELPENLTWLEPSEGLPLMAEVMMEPLSAMMTSFEIADGDVLFVRYEDFLRSSEDFDATYAKIMDFFFENEVSEDQKKAALASAKLEDSHGPFGLSKSLEKGEVASGQEGDHTNDEQAMNDVRKYLKLIRQETYDQLDSWRRELGYHTPIQFWSHSAWKILKFQCHRPLAALALRDGYSNFCQGS